jgi:hypothetical protein
MKWDNGIGKKYRKSIEAAFDVILEKGDRTHRRVMREVYESNMLVRCLPVSIIHASGNSGVIDHRATNERITEERLSLREALGEVYITIAEETIDTGFQRGCEGTFVHEGQHAFDFAQVIESFSNTDVNPLSIFDPTLYELEWAAHKTSANYMIQIGKEEYLQEGLDLMILGKDENGNFFVSDEGIKRRLRESYGLEENGNQGSLASQLAGLKQR